MTISTASRFHFPCPLQQSGSGSGKPIKCRARGLIKKRDPAHRFAWLGAVSLRGALGAFSSVWLMPRFECAEHYKNSWLDSLERAVTADSLRFDAAEELAARH
jgi:hypothetical protein